MAEASKQADQGCQPQAHTPAGRAADRLGRTAALRRTLSRIALAKANQAAPDAPAQRLCLDIARLHLRAAAIADRQAAGFRQRATVPWPTAQATLPSLQATARLTPSDRR